MLLPKSPLHRAGQWFVNSGIQEPSGGVARYYCSETGANRPVSTEITGYAASAFAWLFAKTGEDVYLERARQTAGFLTHSAWDAELSLFPFEHPSPAPASPHRAYFFDTGIIVRGLMAVWRLTHEKELLDLSLVAARAMRIVFFSGADYHPILELPDKRPLERTPQWSRAPGCYQLKAALAWRDTGTAAYDESLCAAYFDLVRQALNAHREFLRAAPDPHRTMDRLHAYCYFLEALIPILGQDADCLEAYAHGLEAVARHLREIAPLFARSDVYAQLLRARLFATPHLGLDSGAAAEEAAALCGFQAVSSDPRIDGGFVFGRRDGVLSPHVNPVSTAFAMQALHMWQQWQTESAAPCYADLI